MCKCECKCECEKVPHNNEQRRAHKHAAVIKAWADGAIIQYRLEKDGKWRDCKDNMPLWHDGNEYRVKPEPPKTVGYRRYVWKRSDGEIMIGVCLTARFCNSPAVTEKTNGFIKWIDTEWRYETVEVE